MSRSGPKQRTGIEAWVREAVASHVHGTGLHGIEVARIEWMPEEDPEVDGVLARWFGQCLLTATDQDFIDRMEDCWTRSRDPRLRHRSGHPPVTLEFIAA